MFCGRQSTHRRPAITSYLATMTSRQLCAFYYSKTAAGLFECKQTRYSNLISHLAAKQPNYASQHEKHLRQSAQDLSSFGFVDELTMDVFKWMIWVVDRNLPLCEVETVGLMLDGWTSHGERCERLLAISPMNDGQSADAHAAYISQVMCFYGQSTAMVRLIVADNCATNQCLATKMKIPLIGCASHQYNLAVNRYLSGYKTQIDLIQHLMIQFRHTNNAAELVKAAPLRPVKSNATRWSSVYQMLKRYVEIRDAIQTVSAVEELVPRGSTHRRSVALVDRSAELDS
ncbi:TPA: hypothetical protein N0F65_008927, partial [Lagenidium giganteum]